MATPPDGAWNCRPFLYFLHSKKKFGDIKYVKYRFYNNAIDPKLLKLKDFYCKTQMVMFPHRSSVVFCLGCVSVWARSLRTEGDTLFSCKPNVFHAVIIRFGSVSISCHLMCRVFWCPTYLMPLLIHEIEYFNTTHIWGNAVFLESTYLK